MSRRARQRRVAPPDGDRAAVQAARGLRGRTHPGIPPPPGLAWVLAALLLLACGIIVVQSFALSARTMPPMPVLNVMHKFDQAGLTRPAAQPRCALAPRNCTSAP